jgi:hypothetical protein
MAHAFAQFSTAAAHAIRAGKIFLAVDVLTSKSGIKKTKYNAGETSKR